MGNLSKRFSAAVAFFIVGLNSVGFGMIENGSNSPGNPVWGFVGPVMDLELYTLKVLTCVIASLGALYIVRNSLRHRVRNLERKEREARGPANFLRIESKGSFLDKEDKDL